MKIFLTIDKEKDLEQIIRYNIGKSHQIRKELETMNQHMLEKESNQVNMDGNTEQKVNKEDINSMDDENNFSEELQEEYLYYYLNLQDNLKDAETDEEILEVLYQNLPVKENKKYFDIMNRIKLEFLKEIFELDRLKQDEDDNDFIQEIEHEKEIIHKLIQMIEELKYKEEDSKEETREKNKLVFLQTYNGSIYAESDLYSIPEEYYPSFQELLLSIENGTFKNVKQFTRNNNILKGISEVRNFKTRVVFERLSKDVYIIIDIFMKKTDCDNGYRQSLEDRVSYYKKNKSMILEQIKDMDYLSEQDQIKDNLIKGLEEKNIVKTMKRR